MMNMLKSDDSILVYMGEKRGQLYRVFKRAAPVVTSVQSFRLSPDSKVV